MELIVFSWNTLMRIPCWPRVKLSSLLAMKWNFWRCNWTGELKIDDCEALTKHTFEWLLWARAQLEHSYSALSIPKPMRVVLTWNEVTMRARAGAAETTHKKKKRFFTLHKLVSSPWRDKHTGINLLGVSCSHLEFNISRSPNRLFLASHFRHFFGIANFYFSY